MERRGENQPQFGNLGVEQEIGVAYFVKRVVVLIVKPDVRIGRSFCELYGRQDVLGFAVLIAGFEIGARDDEFRGQPPDAPRGEREFDALLECAASVGLDADGLEYRFVLVGMPDAP